MEYCTVVYAIDDEPASKKNWENWWNKEIKPLVSVETAGVGPVKITAVSITDELTKLNCIEHVVEEMTELGDSDKIALITELLQIEDPLVWWKENVAKES